MSDYLTYEVEAIGSINLEGNIIPMEWFNYLKLDSGKPDTISILILSDIVYWYRPTIIRDELTGRIIGYKKKFKADILQRSYSDFESLLGFSEKQTREALIRLEKKNLLERVFRHINVSGRTIANVMFIKIKPQAISSITNKFEGGISTKGNIPFPASKHLFPFRETRGSINVNTNTETTTEITTKNSLSTMRTNKIKKSNNLENAIGEREHEIIKIWNDIVEKKLGREIIFTSDRVNLLNKRLKDFFNNDLSQWSEFCQKITRSDFLMGEKTDFRIHLDWALEKGNLIKIIEGTYNREEKKNNKELDPQQEEYELIEDLKNLNVPEFWFDLMIELLKKYGIPTYKSWFHKKLHFNSFKNGILELKAFSKFGSNYIKEHYFDEILNICKSRVKKFKDLKIVV